MNRSHGVGIAVIACAAVCSAAAWYLEPPPRSEVKPRGNRLARETSPYLLMHAHNPVDWYPWGSEAFTRARTENKPIFLSVGYSSCFWCHVMERECFENEAIAALLNKNFICVKVDREERPDVDQVYMTAVQVFGGGGWPMTVFLTPDGRPFFGGTYFPPADRDGMPGLPTLVADVVDAWKNHRDAIERDADRLAKLVADSMKADTDQKPRPIDRSTAEAGVQSLADQFDPAYGGFGFDPNNSRRPKFPEPANLVFLLDRRRRDLETKNVISKKNEQALTQSRRPASPLVENDRKIATFEPFAMAAKTLDEIARGGIRDQLAGGYHRYSVDRSWTVPHFEKMLYDNAQLADVFIEIYALTHDNRWKTEAEAALNFMINDLRLPDGGFASALDAEAGGEEGTPYVWSRDEIAAAVDERDFPFVQKVFGIDRDPNFEGKRYVLRRPLPPENEAEAVDLTPELVEKKLAPVRARLLKARSARNQPLRDDKVIVSWNALAIAAFAHAGAVFENERYRKVADETADFLLAKLVAANGGLFRTYRAGAAKIDAYLEDYAFLAEALLRLYRTTNEPKRLDQARKLVDRALDLFEDRRSGGFYVTSERSEGLIARPKDQNDGVVPSGTSVITRALIELAAITHESRYLDAAERSLVSHSAILARRPDRFPILLIALEELLDARPNSKIAAESAKSSEIPQVKTKANAGVIAEPRVEGDRKIVAGKSFSVSISVKIDPGLHIYANPTRNDSIPPTKLSLEPKAGFRLARVEYPAGTLKEYEPAGVAGKIGVYEGTIAINAVIEVDRSAPEGDATLVLKLDHQACDARSCRAPAKLEIPVPIRVGESTD